MNFSTRFHGHGAEILVKFRHPEGPTFSFSPSQSQPPSTSHPDLHRQPPADDPSPSTPAGDPCAGGHRHRRSFWELPLHQTSAVVCALLLDWMWMNISVTVAWFFIRSWKNCILVCYLLVFFFLINGIYAECVVWLY